MNFYPYRKLWENLRRRIGKSTEGEKKKVGFRKKYKGRKEWKLKRGNVRVRYDTSDRYSHKWFYKRYVDGKIHEPIVTDKFIEVVDKSSVVFDLGGHIGYFSCLAGKLALKGKVVVFEVDPNSVERIRRNIKLNKLKNTVVYNQAVSDVNEKIQIPLLEDPLPGLMMEEGLKDGVVEVDAVRIDDVSREIGLVPDLIKVDVEGAEWKVLKGMEELIKAHKPKMLIEIHVENLRDYFQTDYKVIIKWLLDCGYQMQNLDHRSDSSEQYEVNASTELSGNNMLFCS